MRSPGQSLKRLTQPPAETLKDPHFVAKRALAGMALLYGGLLGALNPATADAAMSLPDAKVDPFPDFC